MNVIIANKNKSVFDNLGIEVIKRLDGEFSVDEIVDTFQNFFFNKMIIDITAIRDYQDLNNIQKLSVSFDMNKIILFLDSGSGILTPDYISKIISIGIYNFTSNLEGLTYLYSNPNTYRDVAQYHHIENMIVEEHEQAPTKPESFVTFDNESVSNDTSSSDSSSNVSSNEVVVNDKSGTKIIGIKSVTPGAGSTTLTYLFKKQLEKKYSVLAIEVEKRDFIYYNDNTLISCASGVIGDILSTNKDKNVLLVDLNGNVAAENYCDDVLYLLEPSIIKVNRLLSIKPKILNELKSKKVILCPSMLSNKDVKDFEYESGLRVFYNLPPVDDHDTSDEISLLLKKLGFNKIK